MKGVDPSRASGIRCRNAPPIKPPAEKPIKTNNNLSRRPSLRSRLKIPTKEIKLTIILAPSAHKKFIKDPGLN